MKVKITGDSHADSGLSKIIHIISEPCEERFACRNYGSGLEYFGVILICLPRYIEFKQRINRSIKKSSLFIDVIVDYELMKRSPKSEKLNCVTDVLFSEVNRIITSRNLGDFDKGSFLFDWAGWIDDLGR